MRPIVLVLALVLAGPVLAGCVQSPGLDAASLRGGLPTGERFDTSRGWSQPLSPALYEVLEGVEKVVPSFDGTSISLGLFLPAIEGCDWEAEEVPEACRLPVVMDAGPYYADRIDAEKFRPPLVEWLVPRGYAVVYMSVRGTGESGGCMEFMSLNEQKDVDAMVTWLAERPWSNGNVGMMGRSYDGTTPLMAAALGNPHLKTIVPISGVTSQRDLMFKNGTSEFRGPIMHSYVYWFNYGLGMADGGATGHRADKWAEQACPEFVTGAYSGPVSALTGDASAAYWEARDFKQRILENYNGSVWVIHGLEDWNVNPSQVVPWFNELQDAGIPAKMWLGVWGHAYPDRVDEHRNVRWDWAEWTVRWFDKWLKGADVDTGPAVEVEDSLFVWRAEESYPPRDAVFQEVDLAGDGTVLLTRGARSSLQSEPMEEAVRIAGLPRFGALVTSLTTGPVWLFAELYDVFPDGRSVRIGWAAIDLAHAQGGNGAAVPVLPGATIDVAMEFEPLDALVAKGHRLRLVVHMEGVEDVLPSPSPGPVQFHGGRLSIPVVERPNLLPSYVPPGLEG